MEPNEQQQFPQPQYQQNLGTPPDNYLVWEILSTVLCCLPFGIVSIVKSTQVNTKFMAGDIAGAQKASADAKKFAIIAAVAGAVGVILYIVFFASAIFMSRSANGY